MTELDSDERPLFSSRYGICTNPQAPPWAQRHLVPAYETLVAPESVRCACPGIGPAPSRCVLRATQEDGQCNQCRQGCKATDGTGKLYNLIHWRP